MTLQITNITASGMIGLKEPIHWYAVYTRSRYEKKVASALQEKGFEAWVPLLKTLRQWSDRKKMVDAPLFRSYIFVRTQCRKLDHVLAEEGAVYAVSFSGFPAIVPDRQIEDLKLLLASSEKFEITYDHFTFGEEVVVAKGILKGLHGKFVHYKGTHKVLMHIEAINQSLLIEIQPSLLKKINSVAAV